MPVTWAIQENFVVLRLVGEHTFEELREAGTKALGSPEFRPGLGLLLDARWSQTQPSLDQIRARMEWLEGLRTRGLSSRWAVASVVGRVAIGQVAAAIAAGLGVELQVFTDSEDAQAWLRSEPTGH